MAAVENLAGVATCREGGGGGLEVHMNLMPPRIPKVSFFLYFGPSGRLQMEGIRAFQIHFMLLVMKKDTYNDIFSRRLLKTNEFLDKRLGLHIFFKI